MLKFYNDNAANVGNDPNSGEMKTNNQEQQEDVIVKQAFQLGEFHRRNSSAGLIFFASTDKARVITEILEGRGWSRTRDHKVTDFTIKWCLANQVDWSQFREGKQLVNNIPGQLTFSDKINLWYTIKDYLQNRRTLDGNQIQTFLPMTFVLDDDNEVTEFLRCFKKQTRTWICKPRYSYAGRGIYVLSLNSDLNTIFKLKTSTGNRLQYQPRLPGYLMQEYIARPLLIKGRKFDIRVHWLVAWTKPLLVFYNHNASVVRLSLNLYREFDFDRATHLTNLSVQENHYRYSFSQEATGMTMSQLNYYFNRCFRPFHPRMCQDWVMTVMQERMQTIIRHVIRASKDKLTRGAGQFGLFGCDFLLDENFRVWLLEINDNPGVGWGNSRVNTTTKPLFEETLNIVFECLEKYNNNQPLLPIECLKNYQLIYNEDDDANRLLRDDNQLFTDRLSIRYAFRQNSSRTLLQRTLPNLNTSRTLPTQRDNNLSVTLPVGKLTDSNSSMDDLAPLNSRNHDEMYTISSITSTTPANIIYADAADEINETIEPLKHDDDIELERLLKSKTVEKDVKPSQLVAISTQKSSTKVNRVNFKRNLSTTNTIHIQHKKRIDLTPVITDKKRCIHRNVIVPISNNKSKTEDKTSKVQSVSVDQEKHADETEHNHHILTAATAIIPVNENSSD